MEMAYKSGNGSKSEFTASTFWEARENARFCFILIIMSCPLVILSLDISKVHSVLFIWVLLGVLFIVLKYIVKAEIKISEKAFDCILCFCSASGTTYFCYLSSIRQLDLSGLHLSDLAVVRQMNQGIIPNPVIFFLLMPAIVTPAGATVKLVKRLVLYNAIVFLIICRNLFQSTPCEEKETCDLDEQMNKFSLIIDITTNGALLCIAWFCCLPAAEVGYNYVQRMDTDIQADAILNNVLKNSIAGAACLLEIEQQEIENIQCKDCGSRPRLTQARNQLFHCMRWCMSRQVMVDLASGNYSSVRTEFNLLLFLRNVSTSIDSCEIKFNANELKGVQSIKFDESMAVVAVDNALYNAVSHGDGSSILLEAHVNTDDAVVSFMISNKVKPCMQLDNGSLQQLAEKARQHVNSNALSLATVNSSAGFYRISMAVTGAGGVFSVHYDEASSTVVLTISLPIDVRTRPITCTLSPRSKSTSSEEGHYSSTSQKSKQSSGIEEVDSFRLDDSDVDHDGFSSGSEYLGTPLMRAQTSLQPFPDNLNISAIDDSKLICKGYERLLLPQLNCNPARSRVCCPKSIEEVDTFVQSALGGGLYHDDGDDDDDDNNNDEHADIVILDQNIDLNLKDGLVTVLGTDLALKLRSKKFDGMIIIRSANSSSSDFDYYMSTGAIDLCAGKSESHKDLAARIKCSYESKIHISGRSKQ